MDRHSTAGLQPPSKIGLFLGAAHHRERRAHGVRLFKPPVLTLFDSANSDKVRVAFRRYQAGEIGSKGVKGHWTGHLGPEGGSGTLTATYGHIQTAVPQFGYQKWKSDTRSRTFIAPRVPALQVPGGRAFGYPKQLDRARRNLKLTGTLPVNVLLADLLPTLLAKKITAPLLACQ
jgi:hypothetical protein